MNYSLIDRILDFDGILVTILSAEGHTYKKPGTKAFFVAGDAVPSYESLGALCADGEIVEHGQAALADGLPRRISIDLSEETDIHFGHGTYCGGSLDLLIEPVLERHRPIYREIRARLESGEGAVLLHDLESGALSLDADEADPGEAYWVEEIPALVPLFIFGATPLARAVISQVAEMDFRLHLIDWRRHYLDQFDSIRYLQRLENEYPFDAGSMVLALSHSFERDRVTIEHALEADSRYIGLLSSKKRRDKMFASLEETGADAEKIARIHCPVGVDIGARTDHEIAVSIAAELVQCSDA